MIVPAIHQKCVLLAKKIRRMFENGLYVDQDAINYMDSTLSNHDIETLEAVFQDPSNCEREPLIELLYFPDEWVQIQLEDFLENMAFAKQDERCVLELLSFSPGETLFHFPEKRFCWKIPTPLAGASAFLSRLCIANNLNSEIIAAINSRVPSADRNRCKVSIRNTSFAATRQKIDSLTTFFMKSAFCGEDFFEQLQFLLHCLSEWKENVDLMKAFEDQKGLYIRQLYQASRLETLHKQRNMETLMIQGIRSPHIDREALLKKIALIDNISLAIFDRSVYVKDFFDD